MSSILRPPINTAEPHVFQPPEECLVFSPTEEEFRNALSYISKIRPFAEQYGIVRIKPPKSWNPPFTVNVDEFKFTPVVQILNEMDAVTRVKLNFLEKVAKFWELQGIAMKIPLVEKKPLDLYSLNRIVHEFGGFEQTTKDRKWSNVAKLMNIPAHKNIGRVLKTHYERLLKPFSKFTSNVVIGFNQQFDPENVPSTSMEFASGIQTAPTHIKPEDEGNSDPIKVFNGKHGVMRVSSPKSSSVSDEKNLHFPEVRCDICNRTDMEEAMCVCSGCQDGYHTFCLEPPLTEVPYRAWHCPRCIIEKSNKPATDFEPSQREYNLHDFGKMADQFKEEYFHQPGYQVSTETVEREFWRIVSSIDEDVVVEYGLDLNTMDLGSGFPIKNSLDLLPDDMQYVDSSWNLNNFPKMEESVLSYITGEISGVQVPWMYVGMCFSSFCWHVEDHWSYSVNYLHWGEPKTWYGVPSSYAEIFESVMKNKVPELFALQPNLLHHLVTIFNPNILMANGIPVYRTDQKAGEFVITFPRAYHAGFNQGNNFAEAVNFATADWLRMGRDCVRHYSESRRICTFSHDELICNMALVPEKLSADMASECYLQMTEMLGNEKKLRKIVQERGTMNLEHRAFERIDDEERQCRVCQTTCFLSAVSCDCTSQIVCLQHHSELCRCDPQEHCLLYRYTIDEMTGMVGRLEANVDKTEN